jgi:prepilin peptidase CpaA
MIATACLLVWMVAATITDVWQQKIYNWTTYSGILVALGLAGLATGLNRTEFSEIGIMQSLIGFAVCGAIMLACFVLFQIGGGDVKLLAMVGAFLGPELGIETLLWTFVLGGAAAVIILIWKIGFLKLCRRIMHQLMCRLGMGSWDSLSEEEKTQLKLPLFLAPAALLAVLIVRFSLVEYLSGSV